MEKLNNENFYRKKKVFTLILAYILSVFVCKSCNKNKNYTINLEESENEKKGTFEFKKNAENDSIVAFKDLADTLVDYLNDNKAMLNNIALTLDSQTPVTLTPGMSIDQIKNVAKELLKTENIEKVSDLKGKQLKVTFNLNDNNQSEEYNLSFTIAEQ